MAIQFYCGLPGSGKSYGCVENALLPAIRANRLIYTNLPLKISEILIDYPDVNGRINIMENHEINGELLMSIPGGALIVLDEAWRFWPSGLKANQIPQKEKEFFAEHRHKVGVDGLTQEICLLSQSPSQLAKVVRDLIDQTVLTRKNTAAGSDNTFNLDIYSGCIKSLEVPGVAINSGFGRYKPDVYRYYQSHTKSQTGMPGMEKRADNRGRIWNHPVFKYLMPIVFAMIIPAIFYLRDVYQHGFNKTDRKQLVSDQAPRFPSPLKTPQKIFEISDSTVYRITGYSINNGLAMVYISGNGVTIRKLGKECSYSDFNGYECVYQGERVARYTGKVEQTIAGYTQHATADIVGIRQQ
jgi:zona occludens toxin (predicted ATPase)